MDHELSRHNISTNTSMMPSDNTTFNGCNEEASEETLPKEFGTEYTIRQARLNEELQVSNVFSTDVCNGKEVSYSQ